MATPRSCSANKTYLKTKIQSLFRLATLNSTIMSQDLVHPAAMESDQLLDKCEVQRTKRSGPGGQHRNKVETAIVITHRPSGMKGEASERRSQHENHRVALFRLRVNLALEIRTVRDEEQTPSELWQARCPAGRIAINPGHDDFPTLLAEALDVLSANDWNIKLAAECLECTTSQLAKFLKLDWRADALASRSRTRKSKDQAE